MKRSSVPNLAKMLHKNVDVRMKRERNFKGKLIGYDAFMNLVLTDVTHPEAISSFVVLRGDSVEVIDILS
jgi:small nuclear ribonucleoprotein G